MSLYAELDKLNLSELMLRFERPCPEGAKYSTGYRMEIASLLRRLGPKGTAFLKRQLRGRDASRVRAAVFALAGRRPVSLKPRDLLKFLKDKRDDVVAEAVDSLTFLKYRDAMSEIRPLVSRANPLVVGAALRYLSAFDEDVAKPLLIKALRHRNFIVRDNACDLLDSLDATEAIPHLIPLLRNRHRFTRQAARTAIKNLRHNAPK